MPDLVVVNTGPLIAWERMGCLDVIGRLPFEFLCPEEVRGELDAGERAGHPRVAPPWLGVRRLAAPIASLGLIELDAGETAVIQLALDLAAKLVAMDEWKGRRAALALDLAVTGSLGLLGKAKKLGLVPSVRSLVERATATGVRYHPAVIAAVLRELGEEP
jgi:predicted nucleic acid-binding protein